MNEQKARNMRRSEREERQRLIAAGLSADTSIPKPKRNKSSLEDKKSSGLTYQTARYLK